MRCVEVAVAAPVRQTYSYLLPDSLAGMQEPDQALVGRRVFVPFGTGRASGYILAAGRQPDVSIELKTVFDLIDEVPLFPVDMVELFRWLAAYYHYPLGQVIKTALPGGLKVDIEAIICLTDKKSDWSGDRQPGIPPDGWFARLLAAGSLSPRESKKVLADRNGRAAVNRLIEDGVVRVTKRCRKDSVGKKLERCYRLDRELRREIGGGTEQAAALALICRYVRKKIGREPGRAEAKTLLVVATISAGSGACDVPRRELTAEYPYGARIIETLAADGLITVLDRRVYRSPLGDLLPFYPRIEQHSDEQLAAIAAIVESLERRVYRTFLLHGITGSGKTEVYLAAAERALENGRGVLVLVPEIALATQLEAHFVSRFGPLVALLHSGLSPGERFDEWSRILYGAAKIVVGARSAVFAPLPDLGLVVVDEEHDGGFKQQDGLRYHARDVAIVRANMNDAVVILGSATPSVTSYQHGRSTKYELLQLSRRVGGRSLPEVAIVDLKKQQQRHGTGLFHAELKTALQETFDQGKQSILLINRRGFSSSVVCLDCGTMVECRHCKVTMNLHKRPHLLLCHYCGYRLPSSTRCVTCGSTRLHPVGFGTERVGEEVATLLPQARIARLDSDIAADRRAFLGLLKAAGNRELDVLVGTQILAKGLHFPDVTLVGIVLADSGLSFPDYRAAEKTYQLIAQVTGRAGRGDTPGRVIIQTLQPDHYAIGLAAEHRYADLADQEVKIRAAAGFPPFARLVFFLVEDRQESLARSRAEEIGRGARDWIKTNTSSSQVSVLGPAPAAIERLRDRYRWQILLKATDTAVLHRLTDYLAASFQRSGNQRVLIDVDPENML